VAYMFERKLYEQMLARLQATWPQGQFWVYPSEYGEGWMLRAQIRFDRAGNFVLLDLVSDGRLYFAVPVAYEEGAFTHPAARRPYSLGLTTTTAPVIVADRFYEEIRAVYDMTADLLE